MDFLFFVNYVFQGENLNFVIDSDERTMFPLSLVKNVCFQKKKTCGDTLIDPTQDDKSAPWETYSVRLLAR